jgi:NAD(P)-dependent dehydrogenase (short-subunit alcohol dehydrogenase family)
VATGVGAAIGKRLAVAGMACVVAWRVVRDRTPAGRTLARLLVRRSGRQMKRSKPVTDSAVMAGLGKLLAVLDVLEDVSVEELRQLLHHVLNTRPDTG